MQEIETRLTSLESTNFELLRIVREMNERSFLMDKKIDNFHRSLDKKIDNIQSSLERKINNVQTNIDNVRTSLEEKIDNVQTSLEEKINNVQTNLDKKIDTLTKFTTSNFESVNDKLDDILIELNKINDVTSYRGIFNNNLKITKRSKID